MDASKLRPHIKLIIGTNAEGHEAAFGPGIVSLCKGVKETGSLNAAAKNMHMAYSKAWRLMKETETDLEVQLLIRDGAHGSTLTEEAESLIAAYDKLKHHLEDEAERSLASFLQ